ncbi:hypothetical protein Sjap_022153 [Stephania japonica]|uniref:Uncharacterized protein n=1 Tax=Stephania japonica TaxID=461633 RepID=A0AAP0ENT6_9MAGN
MFISFCMKFIYIYDCFGTGEYVLRWIPSIHFVDLGLNMLGFPHLYRFLISL